MAVPPDLGHRGPVAEDGVAPREVTGRHLGGIWAQEDPDPDELAAA